MNLKETQKLVKDLILFDNVWQKRNKIKSIPKKTLQKIATYRDLVRNSLLSVISNIYPNTKKILANQWESLLGQYLELYPPGSPILNKAGEHFPEFISRQKIILKRYPFLHELARYEWIELEIYEAENRNQKKNQRLLLNPIHNICLFEYPVHKIIERIENKKALGKVKKQKTNILIYRDPKDLTVRFFELSDATLLYIELLKREYTNEKITKCLSDYFKIKKEDYKQFRSVVNNLVKKLTKNRILI